VLPDRDRLPLRGLHHDRATSRKGYDYDKRNVADPGRSGRPSWQSIRCIIGERVDAKRSAGMVVGVVDSDGMRVAAYGDPGPGQPPLDASSAFEIGSITKVFTAALLADMVARGEVALDEPVALLLPETARVPAWGTRQIELVDLATQTSGLPRLPANWRWEDSAHPMMAGYTAGQLYEFLSGYTLTRQIGSEYEYSNLGFGLLGHPLALRAGTSYEQLVSEPILKPLGMTMTGISFTQAMREHVALPHSERGDVVAIWDYGALVASGGICSTMTDMLTFAAANLDPTGGPLHRAMAATHTPLRDAVGGMRVGLGWHTKRLSGWDTVWHSGETGGSRSFIGLDVEARLAVVVLSNSAARIEDIGFHMLDQRAELTEERQAIDLPAEVLERYVGLYQLGPEGAVTVMQTEGGLVAEATGLGVAPIYPATETEFFVKVIPVELTFQLGPRGAVTGVVVRFAGRQMQGSKAR
jgi:D-alanyl-D-alanine-carboxypeptidase/D-alanyl-D-alanine-endopeptidase